ncbi:MAG TPA: AraC family transcriptional regulator [Blastocatellia bacterium]|nr:AraC family transcriptional regulator [Blastocatellia bacterium]
MTIAKSLAHKRNARLARREITGTHVISASAIPDARVRLVIGFMNENLHRGIPLTDLAELTNLSPFRLSHVFKTQTGLSPGEYLRRLRMEEARDLLATSLLSVKQIMAMAGYNNKNHFTRHFKRSFGVVPSEFRKIIQSAGD